MKLFLPYPVSTNRYWRKFRNMIVVSAEAKAYKQHAAIVAVMAGVKVSAEPVHAIIVLHPRRNKDGTASKTIVDIDNCIKVIFDSLNGVVWVDDKQVKKLWVSYGEPLEAGGLSLELLPL